MFRFWLTLSLLPALASLSAAASPQEATATLLARLYPERVPAAFTMTFSPADAPHALPAPAADALTSHPLPVTEAGPQPITKSAEEPTTAPRLVIHSPAVTPLPAPRLRLPGHAPAKLPSVTLPPHAMPATLMKSSLQTQTEASSAVLDSVPLHINRATAGEIEQKLKIDARRARLIIEFRQAYGPFTRLEEMRQVNGISDRMVQAWEDWDSIVMD